ncbi:FAD/NAD(P)-binding domain-containing protein [Aspergillus heteromorphus CBS 117.55]|uniref:FAD/NAD(P)-binding domain-containing protein n=1 Tax=Aspergillus heteromorphus CBS 117.55 TaxID=1448321 RepID=A0A317VTU3_9EURO|nr:FAD/NAD(P)-binding domain-containing protein [Aspergillus heteromorphus CBS 117.55]PWY76999.1 FAD/NAD(P)-binding domain-containing protein [Aspergillus heteromorphus CBS 117.55]
MPSREPVFSESAECNVDPKRFAFTPRKLKIVCIGAGFSGLILAHKLQHEQPLDFVDFTIYEKNQEVGGTWFENIYPGVGCDVPAHSYVFPFEPNPFWSKCYAGGAEIEEYILKTVEKWELKKHVVLNTRLLGATWNEEHGKWKLKLEQDGAFLQDEADILINGGGIQNRWKMPDIAGLDQFKGKLLHTAAWDKTYDWTGKRIAVIGNGSSALQVVPALQPKAAKIVNFIRQPTWVSVNLCPDVTKDGMGTNFEYTEEEKAKFRDDPEGFLEYRKMVERSVNTVYRLMLTGSEHNRGLLNAISGLMQQRLNKSPHLIDKLIPKTEIGCRRLSPGDGYLESMQEPNADFCFDPIERITKTGIQTSQGEQHDFDLIVCATGFDSTFIPAWNLVGRNGRQLTTDWKNTPQAYFSICAGGAPNYFMFAGPNCPIGHGSVPQMLAWSADYMLQWVKKMGREDIQSVVVKDSAIHMYNRYAQANLKHTVWSTGCQAWYNNGSVVTAMYPGSVLHFKEAISTIRGEDFDIRYSNTVNPFAFLGNGELVWEREQGGDLAYYLK